MRAGLLEELLPMKAHDLRGTVAVFAGCLLCEAAHARRPGCLLLSSMRTDAGQSMLPSSWRFLPSTVRFMAPPHRVAGGQQAILRQSLYIPNLIRQQLLVRQPLRCLQCSVGQQDDQARSEALGQRPEGLSGASNAFSVVPEHDMCDSQRFRSLTVY